jgi:hypothetical protein
VREAADFEEGRAKYQVTLPRIGFEITSLQYDASRKLVPMQTVKSINTDDTGTRFAFVSTPYNIGISMSVFAKNQDDALQIVEQILPFFTPEWTTTVHIIPEMDITVDIPVGLNSVEVQDDYEGNFETRRSLIWTLNFTMKAYVFGPVRKSSIIKFANTNIYDTTSAPNTHLSSVDVRPGLTANGTPTSDAELTISLNEIESIDDYGYIKTVTNPNL